MHTWQLQEAKAKFSEVIRAAQIEPQEISVRGHPEVIMLSKKQYDALITQKVDLVTLLSNSPFVGLEDDEIDKIFARDQTPPRELDLF